MPTRKSPWPNGTPCWIDYGASDVEAAKDFYGRLFGWEFTGGEAESGGYHVATKNGEKASGLAPLFSAEDSPWWTTYFATDDAEATAERIRQAGGSIVMEPMDLGRMGRMVIASDPHGSGLGVWHAGEDHSGVQIYGESGALIWSAALLDDPASAQEFYSAVFGFTFDEASAAEGRTTFAVGGRPAGDLGGREPGLPQGWIVCFAVESVEDTVAEVEAAGGKVTSAPRRDSHVGRLVVLEDPWGAPFSVVQAPTGG